MAPPVVTMATGKVNFKAKEYVIDLIDADKENKTLDRLIYQEKLRHLH
jgi:hypothetical protein